MTSLRGLLRKEFFHIRRDKRTAAVLIALPIVQVMLFGYAIRTDVDNVRLAVVDPAPDTATISLRDRFAAAEVFRIVAVARRTEDLDPLFQSGRVQQAIVFYPGFAEDLGRGIPPKLLVLTDATEPNTGSLLQTYAQSVVNQWAREAAGPGRAGAVTIVPQVRTRFNPTRE